MNIVTEADIHKFFRKSYSSHVEFRNSLSATVKRALFDPRDENRSCIGTQAMPK